MLTLRFGIFFDGTLNSIANIDERKRLGFFKMAYPDEANIGAVGQREELFDKSDWDSYTCEYTNVARFYKCFIDSGKDKIIPIYIEGIGTMPREIGKEIDYREKPPAERRKYENYESLTKFIEENGGFISCSDDGIGSALGVGLFGVKKKVESACEKITDKLNDIINNFVPRKNTKTSGIYRCMSLALAGVLRPRDAFVLPC